MALANFTLPFGGGIVASNWATVSPIQHHATAVNNLLYGPAGHQKADTVPSDPQHPYYKNDPYAPPTPSRQYRFRNNNYLPPPPSPPQQFNTPVPVNSFPQTQAPRPYDDNSNQALPAQDIQPPDTPALYDFNAQRVTYDQTVTATPLPQVSRENTASTASTIDDAPYPDRRPVYTRVQAGVGSKTQVHAVLDYDEEEYYDDEHTSGSPHGKILAYLENFWFL